MQKILLASCNQGKIAELRHCFADLAVELVPQNEFNIPAPEETGLTFVENALLKARFGAEHSGLPTIADDAGLVVNALNGEPGIYSARFAGQGATDSSNIDKLLGALNGVPEATRTAHFHCTLVYLRHSKDPDPLICQGNWLGRIASKPTGSHGFGYDPIFYVPTQGCTAAELEPELKNTISHRGQACYAMLQALLTEV